MSLYFIVFYFSKILTYGLLPRKSAGAAPNPEEAAAAAKCPKCIEGCWNTGGLCEADDGFGLGAKILSIVNKEPLFVVVATEGTRCLLPLYTGLKPSPKKTLPKKCDGTMTSSLCCEVSTIFKCSWEKSPSHQCRSPVSRLKDASVFRLFDFHKAQSVLNHHWTCWLTDNRRQR